MLEELQSGALLHPDHVRQIGPNVVWFFFVAMGNCYWRNYRACISDVRSPAFISKLNYVAFGGTKHDRFVLFGKRILCRSSGY